MKLNDLGKLRKIIDEAWTEIDGLMAFWIYNTDDPEPYPTKKLPNLMKLGEERLKWA